MSSSDPPPAVLTRLTIAWATTLLILLGLTWPLWTPWRDVPRVAPLSALGALPPAFDLVLLGMVGAGVLLTVRRRTSPYRGIGIATAALLGLMAVDQLRWQPWAYHALIVGAVLAASDARRAIGGLRLVAIAVYGYSALAKIDAEFVATLGRQMVGVLVGAIGTNAAMLDGSLVQASALALPLSELGLAVLLAASLRWRSLANPACRLVGLTHLTTIAVLSPWGLGHSLGVLLWNAGFAWQTILLFSSSLPERSATPVDQATSPVARWVTRTAIGLAIFAPLGTPIGLWDQWPGWALYAPGGERATLLIHTAAIDRLPDSLGRYVDADADVASPWRRVRVNDWMLSETGAPIYPQNRLVAAIASGLLERYPLTDRLRVSVESAADRRTRQRDRKELTDRAAIRKASTLFGAEPVVVWTR